MNMTEQEFQRIYRYVKLHYGIDMSKKKEIMTGRLENYVMAHGYTSYDAFMNALEIEQKIWGFGARQLRVGKNHICWQC